jgi:DNA-binding GntR family transcriptional regulator
MSKKANVNLNDNIYEYIKNLILTQKIKCGEKIPEITIAKDLNISRTPVRESVRKLAYDGIVNINPNRSAEVINIDSEMIKNLAIVRWYLDTLAVRLAIYNGSNREFEDLRQIAGQCLEANQKGNLQERFNFDTEFHLKLVEIGKNPILYDMQSKLRLKAQLWQAVKITCPEQFADGIHQHLDIVASLEKRDASEATRLVQEHLYNSYGIDYSGFTNN